MKIRAKIIYGADWELLLFLEFNCVPSDALINNWK